MKFNRAFLIAPGKFEIYEVEEEAKNDEVLIKIASCGLCNWELNFWKGYLNLLGYPHPLGHEYSGTVIETGPDVKNLKAGDNVSVLAEGFGGFGEYKAVSEKFCIKLANGIDPKYALGEPQKCITTVLRATMPECGDNGVMLGCGPMGLWCLQGLSGNLLNSLIAVDIDDARLNMAKKFGATHTIHSKKEDANKKISEITNGRLADFVIEGTGRPSLLNEAQNYLKTGRGRLVLMSAHEEICHEFDFRIAVDKGSQIFVPHPPYSTDEMDDFRRAVSLMNNGTFNTKEIVSHEFKLNEINKAFETLENKPSDFLKGIIIP